ncbi:MAG: toll/interleukin-1 receptor domain-containing protein [Candidatus Aegiribacteria sp.]|nr:toll/interleukin-1 receptor domain-containing protein [Candidatus Aegiribacteria sp.]
MDKYIFISHSSKDAKKVEKVINLLDSSGIKYWISTRDIPPGADWAETIYDAISNSSGMILLCSANVNRSRQIRNELDIATNLEIPLIPLKLEDIEFSKGIRYFTNSHQWLDATDNWKQASIRLLEFVNKVLSEDGQKSLDIPIQTTAKRKTWPVLLLAALSVILVLFAVRFFSSEPQTENTGNLLNLIVGGTDSWDYATDILATSDGGFTATGTWDWGFWSEWWVTHFDSTGNLEWSWSDSLAGEDKPLLLRASNGDVICAAGEYADFDHTGFPLRAIRIDSLGRVIWNNDWWLEWIGAVQPELSSFDMTKDSLLLLSFTLRQLSSSPFLATHQILMSTSGELLHRDTLRGGGTSRELVILENNNRLRVYRDSSTVANGIELMSPDGEIINRIIIGDNRSPVSCGLALPGGDIILFMTKDTYGARNGDLSVMRFTPDLSLKWEKVFGGNLADGASNAILLPDGDILIAGSTRSWGNGSSDGWLLQLSQDGDEKWQSVIDIGGDEYFYSISCNEQGLFFVSGTTTRYGQPDAWILQLNQDGSWNEREETGIDLFTEDWENGFIDQTIWEMGRNRNYTPVLHEDSITGNYSCDANNVPLVSMIEYPLLAGLSFSAEVLIPDMSDARGCNWLAVGITRSSADEFHLDPGTVSDMEIRWFYTRGVNDQDCEIVSVSSYDSVIFTKTEPESLWLQREISQVFTIETCTETVKFWLNDSLFSEDSIDIAAGQDSVRIYLWGSSGSLPHHIDNLRLFRRRW